MAVRWLSFGVWGYLTWIVLTWTATAEQLIFGAVLAALAALACMRLGDVARPWNVLRPGRLVRVLQIGAYVVIQMCRANVELSRRIWSPTRPLEPGMVVSATEARSEGALTAVGVLSSLVVDNQIIDLDRRNDRLQYHGIAVGPATPSEHRDQITAALEDRVTPLERR